MNNIISHFALRNAVREPQPVKVGIINQSYILPSAVEGGESYFLQKINHHIFTDVEGLQHNISVVTDHIRERLTASGVTDIERRVLRLVPTVDGQLFYRTPEGDYWRIYVLIEGGHSEERVTPESAYLAGRAYGDFQQLLADLPEGATVESIPNFHNIEFRMQQLHEAIAADRAGRVKATQDIIDLLLSHEEEMCLSERLHREGRLPKRVSHCDTKVNNMLFDASGRPLCVVDLDTVMPQYVLSDYGDFMRTAACTAPEDCPDLDRIHVDLDVFAAYTRGYLEVADFLTPLEISLLPYGARLFSYMQAVRFFADYLNGDTYYQTQYPEHNLVRTRAQLRLFEEQQRMRPAMEAIVAALAAHKPVAIIHRDRETEIPIDHVNWPDAFPEAPKAVARVSHDGTSLTIHYDVEGMDLLSNVGEDFGEVWTDSCCEMFCRPLGQTDYQNYEINPIGRMTASIRTSRKENLRYRTPEQMATIERHTTLGTTPFGLREGMHHWQVGLTIPLDLITLTSHLSPLTSHLSPLTSTPSSPLAFRRGAIADGGEALLLEANFYKCGDRTPRPHFLSWAPIDRPKPDFHCPEFFGLMVLTD